MSLMAKFLFIDLNDIVVAHHCDKIRMLLRHLLKASLWANRFDLSLTSIENLPGDHDMFSTLDLQDNKILINDTDKVLNYMLKSPPLSRIDIILDNVGMEFFADLCLAHAILSLNIAKKIVFYPKAMPWFVSDVTPSDYEGTITSLNESSDEHLKKLGFHISQHIKDGQIEVVNSYFWTTWFPYSEMREREPALHQRLFESSLIIFKGDLNYRKLVGDLNWPLETPFPAALRGFNPGPPLVALRTLKADVVVGLDCKLVEKMNCDFEGKYDWMVTGEFAVIQSMGL